MARRCERMYLTALHKLADEIFAISHTTHGWDWRRLASEAGLGYSTVQRLGSRITRFPEQRTITLLAKAVGMEVTIKKGMK
jgi:hypothetical protein